MDLNSVPLRMKMANVQTYFLKKNVYKMLQKSLSSFVSGQNLQCKEMLKCTFPRSKEYVRLG